MSWIETDHDGSRFEVRDKPGHPGVVTRTRIEDGRQEGWRTSAAVGTASLKTRRPPPRDRSDVATISPPTGRKADPFKSLGTTPELRDGPPVGELAVEPSAFHTIIKIIEDTCFRYGGLVEAGGCLLGWATDPSRVLTATGPGDRSRHGPGSVTITNQEAIEGIEDNPLMTSLGTWHSHPDRELNRLSPPDLRVARARAAASGGETVDVLVLPGEVGFAYPELRAWVTYQTDDERWVADPLRVTGI